MVNYYMPYQKWLITKYHIENGKLLFNVSPFNRLIMVALVSF